MTELSNAVKVLIARMESHPEDFELYGNGHRPKFANEARALYGLVGLDEDMKDSFWHLNDADKEALIEAWKKYHCTRFEKDIMEKIFDDGQAEREAELEKLKRQHQMHVLQQQAAQQQIARMPQPVTALNNASSLAGSGNYYNGGGLLGSATNAFSGIFK